ncbi:MAG: class I SAM-dependent methyltransferase [Chloroflexota bacterium]
MTAKTDSDNWLTRRMMKLTRLEKQHVNNPKRARNTVQTALGLLEHVRLPVEPRCLEIGCGQGALARLLVERYRAQVVASDYDPAQVALAQERLAGLDGRIDFRVIDARTIPFEKAEFDALFSFGVLHHIPGGWRKALAEIARVLKPGGWFVFTDLVLTPLTGRLVRSLFPNLGQLEEAPLQDCLAQNGLNLEHYVYDLQESKTMLGLMNYCTAIAHRA